MMMHKLNLMNPGRGALVAALALTATPAFAQQATPDQTTPPAQTDTSASTPAQSDSSTPNLDILSASTVKSSKSTKATSAVQRTKSASSASTAKAAPVRATAKAAPVTRTASAPVATKAPATPVAPPPPVALAPAPATPLAAAPAAPVATNATDETLPIAAGAGVGILALAGGALALRRRRRRREEEELEQQAYVDEPMMAAAPAVEQPVVEQPVVEQRVAEPVAAEPLTLDRPVEAAQPAVAAERPAFSWGAPVAATAATAAATSNDGESRVERAMKGPTPDNPFLSLRKRLKRASFYDQRDRLVEAGEAKPVSPMAGLPKRMADKVRETAAATKAKVSRPRTMGYSFSYAPA